jgi:hypothetical protein
LVTQAIENEVKIVFTDEAVFSPKTRLERTWATRLTNIKQLDLRHCIATQALIAGVSED